MTHYTASDDRYRELPYLGDYGSADAPSYRFGRLQGSRVHARTALRRVSGYFKGMIEAIADAKLRRMERELEFRGIRFDRTNDSWVTRKSSTGASGNEAAPDRNGVKTRSESRQPAACERRAAGPQNSATLHQSL